MGGLGGLRRRIGRIRRTERENWEDSEDWEYWEDWETFFQTIFNQILDVVRSIDGVAKSIDGVVRSIDGVVAASWASRRRFLASRQKVTNIQILNIFDKYCKIFINQYGFD